MDKNQEDISRLLDRMNELLGKQDEFTKEVNAIRSKLDELVLGQFDDVKPVTGNEAPTPIETTKPTPPIVPILEVKRAHVTPPRVKAPAKTRSELEKFIGENLINKIGIAVTVIGVSIGAKYAIDKDLISPLVRILLGCLVGGLLIGVGYYLKKNFANFSSVLVSGGIAILYFMTFLGYDLYELMLVQVTFGIMVLLTVYAVREAISYNQQVISLIAMVGAYAVPFLLSDGSGNVKVLFSYMIIINLGILFLSFKKSWKALYYSAFGLSWLIFMGWLVEEYSRTEPLALTMVVSAIFFLIFYFTFLAFKLAHEEKFSLTDVILVLLNSFIYYIICYICMQMNETAQHFVGLFTLGNALLHVGIAYLIHQRNEVDRNIYYLIAGLGMAFITISIPAQLDGNWVTLLWACQAIILFWIGRSRVVPIYEKLAYPMIAITFASLMHDWSMMEFSVWTMEPSDIRDPFMSLTFFTSLLVAVAFGYIYHMHHKHQETSALNSVPDTLRLINACLPILVVVSAYYTIYLEIDLYWNLRIAETNNAVNDIGENQYVLSDNLGWFKNTWQIIYTLVFGTSLLLFNTLKAKSQNVGNILFVLNTIVLFIFLSGGLYALSELRDYYLDMLNVGKPADSFRITIRYIAILIAGLNMYALHRMIGTDFMKDRAFRKSFDVILFIFILWVASSELIHWQTMASNAGDYKLELSILWGVYSLVFVSLGIWLKKQHYRITAISLFALTLLKLFFYDISHLNTISKTIVFVSLGILLLIISFLYNKFKHLMEEES